MPGIFSVLRKGDGSAFIGSVRFRPVTTPLGQTGGVTVEADVTTTSDASGWFGTHLHGPQDYYVWLGNARIPRRFHVPAGTGEFLLEDLLGLSGGTFPLNYQVVGDRLLFINATTGTLHAIRASGTDPYQIAIEAAGSLVQDPTFRWQNAPTNTALQLWNTDEDDWQAPLLTGAVGAYQVGLGAVGVVSANNARIHGAKLQLRHQVDGTWHTLYTYGDPVQLYVGPAE
jgi:hypothetical protein